MNAGHIFGRAVAGYRRAKESASDRGLGDRDMGPMDALESVVFSVAALEGFINETAELASYPVPPGAGEKPPSVASLATLISEADKDRRASLGLKFQLARYCLTGAAYDISQLPYQDFSLLIDLRNSLIHYRSLETLSQNEDGVLVFNPAKILARLRAKNVTGVIDGEERAKHPIVTLWLNRISTVAVARWSCRTASAMVYSVLDSLPYWYWREPMELAYREPFNPPC